MKLLIEDGLIDKDGVQIILDGVDIKHSIPVTTNFNKIPIGMYDVVKDKNGLLVELDGIENDIDGYPCVGLEYNLTDIEKTKTTCTIRKSILREVSICQTTSSLTIKKISEQRNS